MITPIIRLKSPLPYGGKTVSAQEHLGLSSRTLIPVQKPCFRNLPMLFPRLTTLYFADIYAAREKNTIGISSDDLRKEIAKKEQTSVIFLHFSEIEDYLKKIVSTATC